MGVGSSITLDEVKLSDNFYTVEWIPCQIQWFVDSELFHTVTPNDVPGDWVYDHPFFLILNLAVGGAWPGYPDKGTTFPQMMLVDYVRVYQKDNYPTAEANSTSVPAAQDKLHLATLTLEVAESGDSWQASALVTVLNEDDQPVR
jgi:beta-glucanase (GH16 family)